MNIEALMEQLPAAFADLLAPALVDKVIAELEKREKAVEPDPLLTADEAGAELGISGVKVRQLHELGHLHAAPGFGQLRFKRSVVRAYGLPSKS